MSTLLPLLVRVRTTFSRKRPPKDVEESSGVGSTNEGNHKPSAMCPSSSSPRICSSRSWCLKCFSRVVCRHTQPKGRPARNRLPSQREEKRKKEREKRKKEREKRKRSLRVEREEERKTSSWTPSRTRTRVRPGRVQLGLESESLAGDSDS